MPSRKRLIVVAVVAVSVFLVLVAISALLPPGPSSPAATSTRAGAIPADAVKVTTATDILPPVLHSAEFQSPIPMPGPVNTAGAEDSPFISPDGSEFYFFFTPDVRVPAEKQLLDHVTGIWSTTRANGSWSEPARVVLNNDLALDGCPFLRADTLWFCSARAGNYRSVDLYTAQRVNGAWTNVQNAGAQLNSDYKAGEMALSPDGQVMYWGSGDFAGGTNVLYQSNKSATGWDAPFRMANVNNVSNAFLPFVTPDGSEFWFTASSGLGYPGPALFRSLKQGSGWGTPVEIVSQFAGEPTLDSKGNLYFVHHYFRANMTMIEADLYVAYRGGTSVVALILPGTPNVHSGSGFAVAPAPARRTS